MNWMKRAFTIIIGISMAESSQAQQHYNSWFRSTISIPIGKKFSTDNEFQHRRQNGFNNTNLFDRKLMFTYRNWIHYHHNKKVTYSISPFALFSNYKIIQKETDEIEQPNREIRVSGAVQLQNRLLNKLYIVTRTGIEYRIFEKNFSDMTRLRNRLRFRYHISENMDLSVFEELFLNVSGTGKNHCFDHNRMGLNLEYKGLSFIKIDIGYLRISRLPITNTTMLLENNFILNITYLVQKQKNGKEII